MAKTKVEVKKRTGREIDFDGTLIGASPICADQPVIDNS
jgi:hypothetical protein